MSGGSAPHDGVSAGVSASPDTGQELAGVVPWQAIAPAETLLGDGMAAPAETVTPLAAGDGIDPAERTPRSFHLSRQLLERARAAAHWAGQQLPHLDEPTNVSELVERALRAEVDRLERMYNDGSPFPAVQGKLRTGPGASGVERIRRAQRARRRPTP
ncbi:MAG: ParB family protein [Micromonosporaceae bacterium]